jgi:tRNA threonylcarbamoyladenosine biosynthesis protein TsaB
MLILAVETTADLCSVAVRDDQGTLVERAFRHRMHLSERLIGDIDAALSDAGVSLADVEGFAVGIGPGSFTGVRIGVMTVKTWAGALAKPVCGVSALDALAEEHAGVPERIIVPLIRARPGSVYARLYRYEEGRMRGLSEPEAFVLADLAARLAADPGARYLLCGEALTRFALGSRFRGHDAACSSGREQIETHLRAAGAACAFGRADPPRASVIAAIAEARFAAGQRDDPLALVPLYLSPPPIDPRVEQLMSPPQRHKGHKDSS